MSMVHRMNWKCGEIVQMFFEAFMQLSTSDCVRDAFLDMLRWLFASYTWQQHEHEHTKLETC